MKKQPHLSFTTFKMNDLDIAKHRLREKKLSLVFVRNLQVIFETSGEGLSGFIRAIEELDNRLSAASVADKTIGKAAALLCAYSHIKGAYAVTMSKSGQETLKIHKIHHEYQNLVSTILNQRKTDKCPYEKLVKNITNPEQAYKKIEQTCKYNNHVRSRKDQSREATARKFSTITKLTTSQAQKRKVYGHSKPQVQERKQTECVQKSKSSASFKE